MAYSYKPAFVTNKAAAPVFQTSGAFSVDRFSKPVTIKGLEYQDGIRTIVAHCSDGRIRSCRIDRFSDESFIKMLTKRLQQVYDSKESVEFISAGGNPDVWFYDIQEA